MNAVPEIADDAREPRLARARRAFREHFADCFWSSDPAMEITEEDIPLVIAGLRKNGGHKEWREAQALVAPRQRDSPRKVGANAVARASRSSGPRAAKTLASAHSPSSD